MQNLIKKTTLALAIKEAIRQIGIQQQEANIFKHLKESFESKFDSFKKQNTLSTTLKGEIYNNYEYPVGENDRQQYYKGLCYNPNITNQKTNEIVNGEKKPLFLLEAFSRNEDPKRKGGAKKQKREKKQTKSLDTIKKKVKRA